MHVVLQATSPTQSPSAPPAPGFTTPRQQTMTSMSSPSRAVRESPGRRYACSLRRILARTSLVRETDGFSPYPCSSPASPLLEKTGSRVGIAIFIRQSYALAPFATCRHESGHLLTPVWSGVGVGAYFQKCSFDNKCLEVRAILPGGPVEHCGRVEVGDVLLEVGSCQVTLRTSKLPLDCGSSLGLSA